MSITIDANGQPFVTSLYDWETGCIVPAILSDPEGYFGDLGAWAERRMKELGVDSAMSRIVYDD